MLAKALANAMKGKGKGNGKPKNGEIHQHRTMSDFIDTHRIVHYHLPDSLVMEVCELIDSGKIVFPEKYLMLWNKDKQFYGMTMMSGRLEKFIIINNLNERNFRTDTKVAEMEKQVAENCINISDKEERMEINFQSTLRASNKKSYGTANISFLALSNKAKGQFFDLVGCIVVNGTLKDVVHFSSKETPYATHSGDKHNNGYLEHIINIMDRDKYHGAKLIIVVCGYNHTPLHEFSCQQPTLLLSTEYIRGQKITCDFVPIDLTINNLGPDTCAAGIAVFDYSSNTVTVLDKPFCVGRVNTTDFKNENPVSKSFVSAVMAKYDRMNMTAMSNVDSIELDDYVQFETAIYNILDISSIGVSVIKQEGTSLWMELSEDVNVENSSALYPIETGCVKGASALFAPPQQNKYGKLNIVLVSRIPQDLMHNPNILLNGIFIIDTGNKDWDSAIANLDMTGLCMCGGMSMILIKNNDRLYFFRGCIWKGIMSELPEIFSDVTDMISQLIVRFNTTSIVLPFPVFIHRDSNAKYCVCGESRLFTASELVSITDSTLPYVVDKYNSGEMSYDDCLHLMINICIQSTLILTDEKVLGDVAGMLDHCHFITNKKRKLYVNCDENRDEIENLKSQVKKIANDSTLAKETRKKSMKKIRDKIRELKNDGKSAISRKLDKVISEMYRICGQASYADAMASAQRIRKALISESYEENKKKTIATYLEDNESRVTDLVLLM